MSTDEPAAMGAHQCTRHAVPIRGSEVAPAASRRLALRTIVALRMRACVRVCVLCLAAGGAAVLGAESPRLLPARSAGLFTVERTGGGACPFTVYGHSVVLGGYRTAGNMYYMWWYSTAEKLVLPVGYELDSGRDLRTETPKGALVEPTAPRRQRRRPNPRRFASGPFGNLPCAKAKLIPRRSARGAHAVGAR